MCGNTPGHLEYGPHMPAPRIQTAEEFILKRDAPYWAYGYLLLALIFVFFLIWVSWVRLDGKKYKGRQYAAIPLPFYTVLWIAAFLMLRFPCMEHFSKIYGFRIRPDKIELLHVWPVNPTSIPRSALLGADFEEHRAGRSTVGSSWITTRSGLKFQSISLGRYDHEVGKEAARRLQAAMIQP